MQPFTIYQKPVVQSLFDAPNLAKIQARAIEDQLSPQTFNSIDQFNVCF